MSSRDYVIPRQKWEDKKSCLFHKFEKIFSRQDKKKLF